MGLLIKILVIIAIVLFCLFALSFFIYFFNLDMKFASMIEPLFLKHYDRQQKKRQKKDKSR